MTVIGYIIIAIALLLFIPILGIFMIVGIPATQRTINNSRKDTFVDTAKEYANAVKFYNEAIELEDVDSLKYTYAFEKANALFVSKRYSEAKAAALQAISFDANQGEPYMLLASIYATVDPYPADPILNKTKYWAAVDKLQTAKSIDPELAEKANTLINSYRKFYPTKEEVFFKPELAPGADFKVGGLINETVRCRD
mgnify:CR=1 FL=1